MEMSSEEDYLRIGYDKVDDGYMVTYRDASEQVHYFAAVRKLTIPSPQGKGSITKWGWRPVASYCYRPIRGSYRTRKEAAIAAYNWWTDEERIRQRLGPVNNRPVPNYSGEGALYSLEYLRSKYSDHKLPRHRWKEYV